MRAFHPAGAALPGFESGKTFAAWPVWKNSSRAEIKFAPLSKRQAVQAWHDARRYERQTRGRYIPSGRPGKPSRQDGAIGRIGLMVLQALLFDFLNYRSGRLDPSYEAIAAKASVSVRSVARGLVKLKAAGVLNWIRRCSPVETDRGFELHQDTNAYGVAPAGQWPGYRRPPDPPPPESTSWGARPADPPVTLQAIELIRAGDRQRGFALLESDPGDWIARAAAQLRPKAP